MPGDLLTGTSHGRHRRRPTAPPTPTSSPRSTRPATSRRPPRPPTATPRDTTAPAAPPGLAASGDVESVHLSWDAGRRRRRRRLPRLPVDQRPGRTTRGNLVADPAAADATTTSTSPTAPPATTWSPRSTRPATSRPPRPSAPPPRPRLPTAPRPAVPAGVTATAGDGRVTVTWAPAPRPTWPATASSARPSPVATGTELTSAGLVAGTQLRRHDRRQRHTYYYVVSAGRPGRQRLRAVRRGRAPPRPTPRRPPRPTGVTATAGVSSVTVRWTANTESDLRGYRIYRSTTADGAGRRGPLIGLGAQSRPRPSSTATVERRHDLLLRRSSPRTACATRPPRPPCVSAVPTAAPGHHRAGARRPALDRHRRRRTRGPDLDRRHRRPTWPATTSTARRPPAAPASSSPAPR